MCFNSGDGGAAAAAQQQQQQQAAIEAATNQINQNFSGFNTPFYNNYTQANENFGLGQLAQQLQQTQNQVGFKLAGQGAQNSSVGDTLNQSLQQESGQEKQNVVNQALGATNTLQQNVAQQQANLISQAEVANDPASVATGSLNIASSFNSPSPMPAIGQLFGNWANTWLGGVNASNYGAAGTSGAGTGAGVGSTGVGSVGGVGVAPQATPGYGGSFNPVSYVSK